MKIRRTRPESLGERRWRFEVRWFEVMKGVEAVQDGLSAGCLPHPVAKNLIARIEKRSANHLYLSASNVK